MLEVSYGLTVLSWNGRSKFWSDWNRLYLFNFVIFQGAGARVQCALKFKTQLKFVNKLG
jgi:hypothetical protein